MNIHISVRDIFIYIYIYSRRRRHRYRVIVISDLGKKMNLHTIVLSSATIFYRRFFLKYVHSFVFQYILIDPSSEIHLKILIHDLWLQLFCTFQQKQKNVKVL